MTTKKSGRKFTQRVNSVIAKPFKSEEKIILRDYLALQRTTLANERTLFSYVRTSLYLILGGIGLTKVELFENLKWVGTVALVVSGLILIYGISRFFVLKSKLRKFYNIINIEEDIDRKEKLI